MVSTRPGWRGPECTLVLLALVVARASALSQEYCSNQNTGSDYSSVSNSFQSNGACSTTCSGYAFAVVQGKSCWCSNYIPASQSSTGSCGVACPGYPYENCGDQSAGLFGYVALGPSPSGTQGAAPSSPADPSSNSPTANTNQATSSPDPSVVTVQATVTDSPSVSISYVSITPSTTTPVIVPVTLSLQTSPTSTTPTTTSSSTTTTPSTTSTTPSTSSSSSTSWSPTPVTQVETVTGQVKTLTITPTTPPAAIQTVVQAKPETDNSFSQSPGKIAGVSIAVVVICTAIIGATLWFCLRRKQHNEEVLPVPSTAGADTPQRRPSRLSQMGLIGGGAGASSTQKSRSPPTIVTSGWGPGNTNSAEKSPADTLDRRSSYPRVVDQRLEPTALWNPLHDNGSHISVRSFRDDQDYSRRMLRIANPDDG